MILSYISRIIFITVILIFLVHPGFSQEKQKAFTWNADDNALEWHHCPEFILFIAFEEPIDAIPTGD